MARRNPGTPASRNGRRVTSGGNFLADLCIGQHSRCHPYFIDSLGASADSFQPLLQVWTRSQGAGLAAVARWVDQYEVVRQVARVLPAEAEANSYWHCPQISRQLRPDLK